MVNHNGLLAKVIPCTQRTVYIRRLMIQIRRVFDHLCIMLGEVISTVPLQPRKQLNSPLTVCIRTLVISLHSYKALNLTGVLLYSAYAIHLTLN